MYYGNEVAANRSLPTGEASDVPCPECGDGILLFDDVEQATLDYQVALYELRERLADAEMYCALSIVDDIFGEEL